MRANRGHRSGCRGRAPRVNRRISEAKAMAVYADSLESHLQRMPARFSTHRSPRSQTADQGGRAAITKRTSPRKEEQGLERTGSVSDLDLVMAWGQREGGEIGRHADERLAIAVDGCDESGEISDLDQRIAGALNVDGRAIDLVELGLGDDMAARSHKA